ncbi:MAG: T9SS type A sorting domain-containing protein, partial [Bacteroidetes bacterium]|nr:T9SS type A sorting domain-containing protein [Bacteroidota bacterium]
GTQDNGTQFIPFLGLNDKQNAIEVNGGDGGYTEISKFNPNAFFAATPQGGLLRSANAGGSFSDFYDLDIIPDPPGGSFVTPFLLWEGVFDQIVDTIIIGKIPTPIQGPNHAEYDTIIDTVNTPAKFFVGLDNNVYMTKEATDFSLTPEWFRISKGISGVIESMAISKDGDVLYVGNNAGRIYRITNIRNAVYGLRWSCAFNFPDTTTITCFWTPDSANVITDEIALFASRNVTGLSVDPNDNAHVVMTLGNYNNTKYVYETKNGLDTVPSWTSIQGNLPAMPVYSVVIDANDGNIIYLGTEFGVWASSNGGGSWSVEIGGDMDNVPTFMIRQEHHPRYWDDPFNATYKDSFVLYIATHGRGLFSSGFDPYVEFPGIEDEETNITFSKSLQVYPNPINNEGYAGFIMEKTADVHIEIYDLQGRLVEHYEELDHIAGKFIYVIDGTKFHNGTYLIRAITENETRVAKMIILR